MRIRTIPSLSDEGGQRAARLLVVDDESEIRDLLRRHLAYRGCDVTAACDGAEALACIAKNRPDVVISDISMPKMNGLELLKRIHADYPMVRVIMITGYVSASSIMRCMNNGADTCVLKPLVDLEELETAIETALASVVHWWKVLADIKALKPTG